MGSQIGRLDGLSRRRSGAAGFTARVAQTRVVRQELHLPPTIATPASQIGWLVGPFQRKRGAAQMRERGVRLRLEDAHDQVEELDQVAVRQECHVQRSTLKYAAHGKQQMW